MGEMKTWDCYASHEFQGCSYTTSGLLSRQSATEGYLLYFRTRPDVRFMCECSDTYQSLRERFQRHLTSASRGIFVFLGDLENRPWELGCDQISSEGRRNKPHMASLTLRIVMMLITGQLCKDGVWVVGGNVECSHPIHPCLR